MKNIGTDALTKGLLDRIGKLRSNIERVEHKITEENALAQFYQNKIKTKGVKLQELKDEIVDIRSQKFSLIYKEKLEISESEKDTTKLLRENFKAANAIYASKMNELSKLRKNCDDNLEKYSKLVNNRWNSIQSLPLVAKINENNKELDEVNQKVENKKNEIDSFKSEIALIKEKGENIKFETIAEWGVVFASGMLKKQKIEINIRNEKAKLKKKLQELKQKKEKILKEQNSTPEFVMKFPTTNLSSTNKLFSFESFLTKNSKMTTKSSWSRGSSGDTLSRSSSGLSSIFSAFKSKLAATSCEDIFNEQKDLSSQAKKIKLSEKCFPESANLTTAETSSMHGLVVDKGIPEFSDVFKTLKNTENIEDNTPKIKDIFSVDIVATGPSSNDHIALSNFEKNISDVITPASKDLSAPVNVADDSDDQLNLFAPFMKKSSEIQSNFQFNFENESNLEHEFDNRSFALNLSGQTTDASFNFSSMFENPQKFDEDNNEKDSSLFSSMFGGR